MGSALPPLGAGLEEGLLVTETGSSAPEEGNLWSWESDKREANYFARLSGSSTDLPESPKDD